MKIQPSLRRLIRRMPGQEISFRVVAVWWHTPLALNVVTISRAGLTAFLVRLKTV